VLTEALESLLLLLAPFTPHLAEELWAALGHEGGIFSRPWPVHEENLLVEEEWTIVVQVNGKMRGRLTLPADSSEEEVVREAAADRRIREWTEKGKIVKTVYVPGKLVNIVVK
jgi:leucyl-tRNA synthetase